jgi:hypothetical protein
MKTATILGYSTNGQGVPQDVAGSRYHFRQALGHGCKRARYDLILRFQNFYLFIYFCN